MIDAMLARARQLAAAGQDAAAQALYLDILRRDPVHFSALNELATLAYQGGHRSAARLAYERAVQCQPANPLGRVNLGNLLLEDGDFAGARAQYEAALAAHPNHEHAHRGMARALFELGEHADAALHWRKGFVSGGIAAQPYRGSGAGVAVLLLVSARGGNIPTKAILDDRSFAVTALYTEFHDPSQPLPEHAVVFNAIGDADRCSDALAQAETVVSRTHAPVINAPSLVAKTGRAANAARLAGIADVAVPAMRVETRATLAAADGLSFPLLLRAAGFHTGRHFLRIDAPGELASALDRLPEGDLLVIDFLDARGADGLARKYRVMTIDGVLYPLHLAASRDWKVHYFSADMAKDAALRAEEERILTDMEAVLGPRAVRALGDIARCLELDYAGIDFGVGADGKLLFFEANATMVINPPGADAMWDYRRAPIARALEAAKQMVRDAAAGNLNAPRGAGFHRPDR